MFRIMFYRIITFFNLYLEYDEFFFEKIEKFVRHYKLISINKIL